MKLDLTKEEVNLILSALAELPAKTSYNLINKVIGQLGASEAEATAEA